MPTYKVRFRRYNYTKYESDEEADRDFIYSFSRQIKGKDPLDALDNAQKYADELNADEPVHSYPADDNGEAFQDWEAVVVYTLEL